MPPHEVLASPVALLVQLIPCSCMLDGVRAPLGPSCRMAKMTGFQTERTKPFPITELDFSGNLITSEGIGAVVQFARTQGMDATVVDLSKNKLGPHRFSTGASTCALTAAVAKIIHG